MSNEKKTAVERSESLRKALNDVAPKRQSITDATDTRAIKEDLQAAQATIQKSVDDVIASYEERTAGTYTVLAALGIVTGKLLVDYAKQLDGDTRPLQSWVQIFINGVNSELREAGLSGRFKRGERAGDMRAESASAVIAALRASLKPGADLKVHDEGDGVKVVEVGLADLVQGQSPLVDEILGKVVTAGSEPVKES